MQNDFMQNISFGRDVDCPSFCMKSFCLTPLLRSRLSSYYCEVRPRYRSNGATATVVFDEPQFALTPA